MVLMMGTSTQQAWICHVTLAAQPLETVGTTAHAERVLVFSPFRKQCRLCCERPNARHVQCCAACRPFKNPKAFCAVACITSTPLCIMFRVSGSSFVSCLHPCTRLGSQLVCMLCLANGWDHVAVIGDAMGLGSTCILHPLLLMHVFTACCNRSDLCLQTCPPVHGLRCSPMHVAPHDHPHVICALPPFGICIIYAA